MQSCLLKTTKTVTLAFHICLDKSLEGHKLSCSSQLISDLLFFCSGISLRFSDAKGKKKTKCNIVAIYLRKKLFWSLLLN